MTSANGKIRRVGITMRVVQAENYNEPRDALAQDWAAFLSAATPGINWLAVPNIGEKVIEFVKSWELEAFILTGGEDLGVSSLRDKTERMILEFAVSRKLPVFGVCRGFQMLQTFFNGKTQPCSQDEHVSARHDVLWLDDAGSVANVNSYHSTGIPMDGLARCLEPRAVTLDRKWVEAAGHQGLPMSAVMWHPEREKKPNEMDLLMLNKTFGLE